MLNRLWLGFFLVAAGSALWQMVIGGHARPFSAVGAWRFSTAKLSGESMLLLVCAMLSSPGGSVLSDPTLVFVPILLATSASTLTGLLSVAIVQKLKVWNPVVLAWLGGFAVLLAGFIAVLTTLPKDQLAGFSSLLGNLTLFAIVIGFLLAGAWKKVPVYESFVE